LNTWSEYPAALDNEDTSTFFKDLKEYGDFVKNCVGGAISLAKFEVSTNDKTANYATPACSNISTYHVAFFTSNSSNGTTAISISPTTEPSTITFTSLENSINGACMSVPQLDNTLSGYCTWSGVIKCIQSLAQSYSDWNSWASYQCQQRSQTYNANNTNTAPPATMVTNGSSNMQLTLSAPFFLLIAFAVFTIS
jgi:hypothetical protein